MNKEQAHQRYDLIKDIVCAKYDVDYEQLKTDSRAPQIRLPRQVIHYLAKNLTTLTLEEIASKTKKDHATVINSCKKIENAITPLKNGYVQDLQLRDTISTIQRAVKSHYEGCKVSNLKDYYTATFLFNKDAIRSVTPNLKFEVNVKDSQRRRELADRRNVFLEIQTRKEVLKDLNDLKQTLESEILELEKEKNEIYA